MSETRLVLDTLLSALSLCHVDEITGTTAVLLREIVRNLTRRFSSCRSVLFAKLDAGHESWNRRFQKR